MLMNIDYILVIFCNGSMIHSYCSMTLDLSFARPTTETSHGRLGRRWRFRPFGWASGWQLAVVWANCQWTFGAACGWGQPAGALEPLRAAFRMYCIWICLQPSTSSTTHDALQPLWGWILNNFEWIEYIEWSPCSRFRNIESHPYPAVQVGVLHGKKPQRHGSR